MYKIINTYRIPFTSIGIIFSSVLLFLVLNYDTLFQWFHPDDLAVISSGNQLGYLGCVKNYFLNTTLNRLTADALVCTFNMIDYAGSPFAGLVLLRIILLLIIPITIYIILNKYVFEKNFVYSFASGIIISSLATAIIFTPQYTLFPLDIVMYYASTGTFLLLLYGYLDIKKSNKNYLLFILYFTISANSHEIIMALCGLLLIKYAFDIYNVDLNHIPNKYIRLKSVLSLKILLPLIILAISLFISVSPPGYTTRLNIWSIDYSFINVINFIFLNIEEFVYTIYIYLPLLVTLLIIGILFSILTSNVKKSSIVKLIKLFLIFGILYALIASVLISLVPSLYHGGSRTLNFQIYERIFNVAAMSIPVRSMFFPLLFINISVFLFGIYIGSFINHRKYLNVYKYAVVLVILFLSIIHPDIKSSVSILTKILSTYNESRELVLFNSIFDKSEFDNKKPSIEIYNEQLLKKKDKYLHNFFYNRSYSLLTPSFELNILGDKILSKSSLEISRDNKILKKIEDSLRYPYQFRTNTPYWYNLTYLLYLKDPEKLYKIYMLESPCLFDNFSERSTIKCLEPFIYNKNEISFPYNLNLMEIDLNLFNQLNLVEITRNNQTNCIEISDNKNIFGEHFAATQLNIPAGKIFFKFNGLESTASNYVYLIGSTSSVLVPWSKHPGKNVAPAVFGDQENGLKVLFLQSGFGGDKTYLSMIVESSIEQNITLRFQNSFYDGYIHSTTVYKVDSQNTSITCGVKIGKITK